MNTKLGLIIAAVVFATLTALVSDAFAEVDKCATATRISMKAVRNMTLLDFMKAVAAKAGMGVVDKGIGHMRITGEAFSALALPDLLREASRNSPFSADIKDCNVVLSPVLPLLDSISISSTAMSVQPSLSRKDIDLARLAFDFAEKSGRSVTMIGNPVPVRGSIDGVVDMDAQKLATAINDAATGVMRVTFNDKTIILKYLSPGAALTSAAQDQFREQGQFVVLPAQTLSQ